MGHLKVIQACTKRTGTKQTSKWGASVKRITQECEEVEALLDLRSQDSQRSLNQNEPILQDFKAVARQKLLSQPDRPCPPYQLVCFRKF